MCSVLTEEGGILLLHTMMGKSGRNDFLLCLAIFPIPADSEREGMCPQKVFTIKTFPGVSHVLSTT